MAFNRSGGRDIHIYSAKDRHNPQKEPLGGLISYDNITNSNLFEMLTILLVFDSSFSLENEQGVIIESNSDQLQSGDYYVAGKFRFIGISWVNG